VRTINVKLEDKIMTSKVWNPDTCEAEDSTFSFIDALLGKVPGVKVLEVFQEAHDQIVAQTGNARAEVVKE
jgi:hypothetical protein